MTNGEDLIGDRSSARLRSSSAISCAMASSSEEASSTKSLIWPTSTLYLGTVQAPLRRLSFSSMIIVLESIYSHTPDTVKIERLWTRVAATPAELQGENT
jgi:hypothetical protein